MNILPNFKRKSGNVYSFLAFLLFVCLSLMPDQAQAQKEKTVTLNVQNETVENVFVQLGKQTGLKFFYDQNVVNTAPRISIKVKNSPLQTVLDKITEQTNLFFNRDNNTISVGKQKIGNDVLKSKTRTIKGTVVDETGESVIGATVMVKGTTNGVTTNLDGNYTLNDVPDGATILISYIGYQTVELKSGSKELAKITLKENSELLDEVVVLGYGNIRRSDVTGSIASVSSESISKVASASVADALAGKMAGVQITTTDGALDAEISIRVRGGGSITQDNSPLFLVDGFPVDDLSGIPPTDIESIDVLKDASAGAIYGTRAAGGVILVTTKKAKEGPITLSYTGELSTEQVSRRPQVLDRDAFVRFGVGTDLGASTDWYGELLNEGALSQRHVVNLSGGGHTAKIYATIMAQDQKGIAIGDNRKDYSGRINANFNLLDDLLEIGLHTEYREAHRDQRSSSSYFDMALKMNPTEHVYDSTSETGYNVLVGGSEYYNPLAEVMLKQADNVDKWLKADATVKLNLPAGFSAQATLGWEDRQYQQTHYTEPL